MKIKKVLILLGLVLLTFPLQSCQRKNSKEIVYIEPVKLVGKVSNSAVDSNYYFQQLQDEEEKDIYCQIYDSLVSREAEIEIESIDISKIRRVYNCVMYDSPEIFYVDEFAYIQNEDNEGNIVSITMLPKYNMTETEQKYAQQEIDQYQQKIFSSFTEDMSPYDKEKLIYEYLVDNTEYTLESEYNQDIYSIILGKSVCAGYAKMFMYLCEKAGMNCTIVTGSTLEGVRHAWNAVKINGKWYMVDCANAKGMLTDSRDVLSYYLFNVTEEIILYNYNIDNEVVVPECNSISMDYFYKNDLYFDSVDTEKYKELIQEHIDSGDNSLVIRTSSTKVLNEFYYWLINNKNIFEILENSSQVEFTKSNKMLTLQVSW